MYQPLHIKSMRKLATNWQHQSFQWLLTNTNAALTEQSEYVHYEAILLNGLQTEHVQLSTAFKKVYINNNWRRTSYHVGHYQHSLSVLIIKWKYFAISLKKFVFSKFIIVYIGFNQQYSILFIQLSISYLWKIIFDKIKKKLGNN